jgi:putative ABC transport system substrate-binding protein
MKRREALAVLGGAVAAPAIWPFTADAQQPVIPVIGWLDGRSAAAAIEEVASTREALKKGGFIEGQTVSIEYRWADGQYRRLPELAADLVRRQVNVLAAVGGPASSRAAKAATNTIPIVFTTGADPVKSGLVASLNRPGGNLTGIHILTTTLNPKRLELLHEVLPKTAVVAVLMNPTFPDSDTLLGELEAAARAMGRQIAFLNVSDVKGIDAAFATIAERRYGGLLVPSDPFLSSQSARVIGLTKRHMVPAISLWRDFAVDGGLMSYGTSLAEAYYQAGIYLGRILKGEKPADLPVHQSTKIELVINLKTAKELGVTFPLPLLGRADEVIE